MSDSTHKAQIVCEHHWISIHQPDLPIYWIDQCSQCEKFNAERMVKEIERVGYKKVFSDPSPEDRTIESEKQNHRFVCEACGFFTNTLEHSQRCVHTYG